MFEEILNTPVHAIRMFKCLSILLVLAIAKELDLCNLWYIS